MQEEVKEIDVEEIFRDVEKDLGSEIRESRSRITGNFKEAPRITYIPGHFRSILQNLMANAIKFHSDQRKPVISVSTGYGDELFYVVVKDNGIGIDETKKEKVFGLFQRLTTTVPGKGMGLFITKSLVESMGGSIDFNSEPDMGTEFRVSLKNLAPGKGI
jgi:signal transduction histidine kinase